jgi:hypothetical protein
MGSRNVTEGRLRVALERLLNGEGKRVRKTGKLSLNKVNDEAGLGHSYIHKFKDFINDEANPAIEAYNANCSPLSDELEIDSEDLTEVDKLKTKLKKEIALKERYRHERDDALAAKKLLEAENSKLMFRVYEQQDELRVHKVVNINSHN